MNRIKTLHKTVTHSHNFMGCMFIYRSVYDKCSNVSKSVSVFTFFTAIKPTYLIVVMVLPLLGDGTADPRVSFKYYLSPKTNNCV